MIDCNSRFYVTRTRFFLFISLFFFLTQNLLAVNSFGAIRYFREHDLIRGFEYIVCVNKNDTTQAHISTAFAFY